MSQHSDHDRVRQLLERIDEITKESEAIRRQLENIRDASPEWPERRRVSRVFDDWHPPPEKPPSQD